MRLWTRLGGPDPKAAPERQSGTTTRILTDGGTEPEDDESEEATDENQASETEETDSSGAKRSNVEVTDEGEAEPVDPKWEKPDIDDIPEVDGPKTRPAQNGGPGDGVDAGAAGPDVPGPSGGGHGGGGHGGGGHGGGGQGHDSTAGMPNNARSPGQSRLQEGGADGFVVSIEMCARLPDDVRLPEEATDLVPVALEAELEQDVQSFAAEEFDNPKPHVDTLDFVEVDGDVWFQLRLGVPPAAFDDLDPDEIQEHALQQVDAML